jgi:hypothetical protein
LLANNSKEREMKNFVLIILMSVCFLCSCSSRNGVDRGTFYNKVTDTINRASKADGNIQFLDNPKFSHYSEEDKNFTNILMSKGFTKNESHVMISMIHEKYSDSIEPIKFNGWHFWYVHNGQTNLNCGIFAVIRLLYHLGLQGIVDKDLWYKNNITQLRKIAASIAGKQFEDENALLPESAVLGVLRHVGCPDEYIKIERVGPTYEREARKQIANLNKEITFLLDLCDDTCSRSEMFSRIDKGYYSTSDGKEGLTKMDCMEKYLAYPGNKAALRRVIEFDRREIERYQKMIDTGDYTGLNL